MTPPSNEQTVFVVDDEQQAAKSVCELVNSMGVAAQSYSSAQEFLNDYTPDRRGCLVTDVRMEEIDGVQLQAALNEQGALLPVIAITADADTSTTVKLMQQGAQTLLEKPYEANELWNAIFEALQLDWQRHSEQSHRQEIQGRFDLLSDKEVDVLRQIIAGKSNKQIAAKLDVSLRTIEARRHEIFRKMEAKSVAELVRLVIEAGVKM